MGLVDVGPDEVVLLLDGQGGRSLAPLRERTPHVHVRTDASSLPDVVDLVCVDGVTLSPAQRREVASRLSSRGRWVQLSDNRLSVLRRVDRARGRPAGSDACATAGALERRLSRDTGLEVHQAFAVLRSSVRPVTAFDVRARSGLRQVVGASLTHVAGLRGLLLRGARRVPPRVVGAQAPAWLLVLVAAGAELDPDRVVGMIGNRDSEQVKLLRGDPPTAVEKHFPSGAPDTEAAALRELAERGFPLAPRLQATSPTMLRYAWQPGGTLPVRSLSAAELETWVVRAAEVLAALQDTTRDPDGSVLVHGDFWLGNLLVSGQQVTGLLDWDTSERGGPERDAAFLVDSLATHHRATPELLARWHRLVSDVLA